MKLFKPKDFQEECLTALNDKRKQGAHSALVVMATGLGKTVVSAFDVRQYMSHHGKNRALFLCHNNGILEQNMCAFQDVLDGEFSYGLFNGLSKAPEADFVFASFQTMLDHKEEFTPDTFKYIAVDEAHHAPAETFRAVIDYFQPDFLLGMTATPERLDGLRLEDIFGPITYNLELVEAIKRGLLVDIDYHLVLDEMADLDSITVEGEKISMGELNRRLFIPKRDEEIVSIIEERLAKLPDSSTLIFCRSIEHAEQIGKLMKNAEIVHSRMSAEQCRETLNRFRTGELPTIISVDQLNEGIDVPHADTIVFLRSTASQVVFHQQLGRGLRLHDGKDKATVLDFVGNYKRLGTIAKLQSELNSIPKNGKVSEESAKEHFVLNIEASQFTDRQVDIVSILDRINGLTWGWSDEELITQVQMLAKELGRTPSKREFYKDPRIASAYTASSRFGSWNKFLEAAGLEANQVKTKVSDEELITQVQMLAKELGRTPSKREFYKDPRIASAYTASSRFGSWNKFLEAAGLKTNKRTDIANEELIAQVQMLAKELGRTPTYREFDKDPRIASADTASSRFGSWNKFLEAAGLKTNKHGRKKGA